LKSKLRKKLKFAFFNHSLRLGSGIDTVITELASRLVKNHQYSVTVYCFNTDYIKEDHNFEIKIIRSRFTSTTNRISVLAPFLMDKIGDLIPQLERYDIVNTHVFPANYISRNLRDPLKVVTDWTVGHPSLWPSSLKHRLYVRYLVYRGNKIAVQKADLVISSSKFVSRWIEDNYKVTPTLLYLDGINFELLDRSKSSPDEVYLTYPRAEAKQIILFVGRITDHKNIHTLIESFYLLQKKIGDVILFLVGDYKNYMSYYLKLKALLKEKGIERDVIFTGIIPWKSLCSYYSACSIYATCTAWEGFLRPESFAFGKPIVCFDVGPNSETVIDGKTGFLVAKQDPEVFAWYMQKLLSDNSMRQKFGEEGYRWAKRNLDFNILTDQFKNLCEIQLKG
jgi:glycosyltransferase involved in cell wall biosynthesis